MDELDKQRRKYRKICLHPKSEECSNTKAHAHSISQKAVLELISEHGMVLMPVVYGITNEFQMKPLGIEAQATKFYCFCSQHDRMFCDIDKRNMDLNEYSFFLYAYRSFAATYYKVIRELDCFKKLSQKYDFNFNPYAVLLNVQIKNSIPTLEWIKRKFNNSIVTNNYDCLESIYLTLDYRVYFAASTCFNLIFDIFGNRIKHAAYDLPMGTFQSFHKNNRLKLFFRGLRKMIHYMDFLKNS